jgi:hypothetical protein
MGHLPVLLCADFDWKAPGGAARSPATPLRRDFMLFDVFDAVLAEITFHGDPAERDRWWREYGSRELDPTDLPEDD